MVSSHIIEILTLARPASSISPDNPCIPAIRWAKRMPVPRRVSLPYVKMAIFIAKSYQKTNNTFIKMGLLFLSRFIGKVVVRYY